MTTTTSPDLRRVQLAARKHARARGELERAMQDAAAAGASLRPLASAAGISVEWTRQIVRGGAVGGRLGRKATAA